MKQARISAIVMADGLSTRMGGVNKLLLPYKGKPLFMHIVGVLKQCSPYETILVASNHHIISLSKMAGVKVVLNPHPESGIANTICLGTEAATGSHYLYCASDQPRMDAATIRLLMRRAGERIVCPAGGDEITFPAIFPAAYRQRLLSLQDASPLTQGLPGAEYVQVDPRVLEDIDAQSDYSHLV